jgi:hypothetical protein
MEDKCFLVQIKHTNDVYEKGVVVKESLNDALQSLHAYFGAYGYGHDTSTDYVQCAILDMTGLVRRSEIDDRRQPPEPESSYDPEMVENF